MCECVYAGTLTPEPILRALFRSDRQTGKQARETRVIKISSTDPSVGRARHYATTTTPGGAAAAAVCRPNPKGHREALGNARAKRCERDRPAAWGQWDRPLAVKPSRRRHDQNGADLNFDRIRFDLD